jgi:hypothetical protein
MDEQSKVDQSWDGGASVLVEDLSKLGMSSDVQDGSECGLCRAQLSEHGDACLGDRCVDVGKDVRNGINLHVLAELDRDVHHRCQLECNGDVDPFGFVTSSEDVDDRLTESERDQVQADIDVEHDGQHQLLEWSA